MKTPAPLSLLCLLALACLTLVRATGAEDLRERIYVQTDKQVYLPGEMLWLKVYLTDTDGKPASFSKVAYVELVDGYAPQVQVKVALSGGTGEGWMELPANLSSGYYRLTAYTAAMRNEGEDVFFRKPVALINPFRVDRSQQLDATLEAVRPSTTDHTLTLSTDRPRYPRRTQGRLQIEGLPANLRAVAVSIAGCEFVPVPEPVDINRWSKALPLLPQAALSQAFTPEYEGPVVGWKLTDAQTGTPPGEEVSLLAGLAGDRIRVYGSQAGSDGQAKLYTHPSTGPGQWGAAVQSPSGRAYRLEMQSPFATHTPQQMPAFGLNPAWEKQLVARSIGVQAEYAYTKDSLRRGAPVPPWFDDTPDVSYLMDEYTRFDRMNETFIEFIPRLRFHSEDGRRRLSVVLSDFSFGRSLVLLDGVPVLDHDLIYNYNPRKLHRIDIYQGSYYFGGQYFEGIAFFRTAASGYLELKAAAHTHFFDYEGIQPPLSFYAPSYAEAAGGAKLPDYRHTLLWSPSVPTGGHPTLTLPFSTSDLPGDYQVTVEALTPDGHPLHAITFFHVE
jgi:hypothetical protein